MMEQTSEKAEYSTAPVTGDQIDLEGKLQHEIDR